VVFVTGSDTGAGKTVLTALLTAHLRRSGTPALAVKPFCSGGRADAELLRAVQGREANLDEINPFYFAEPLAPLVAARKHRRVIKPSTVIAHLRRTGRKLSLSGGVARPDSPSPVLLVEGVGGVLVPLGDDFSVLDLVCRLQCAVLVAAPNKLGTINHCLLTLQALRRAGLSELKLVLMDTRRPDPSSASNPGVLAELISPVPLVRIPFLRPAPAYPEAILRHAARLAQTLSDLLVSAGGSEKRLAI